MQVKKLTIWIVLLLLVIALFFLDIFLGTVKIPLSEIFKILITGKSSHPEWIVIVNSFRVPKALTALAAGIGLSISGLQMQTVFRNPLAGPYVLGISSGASLGVAILLLGFSGVFIGSNFSIINNWMIVIAAWLGSGLILFVILAISMRVKDIMTILILGIMFGSATTAIVSILQYFSNESLLKAFIVWTMGSLGGVSKAQLSVLLPSVLVGIIIVSFLSKVLNAMLIGENYAKSLGLNIKLARFLIFLSTSLLAGSITAFCGPIGFVGIAVPHIARMVFKTANHNILIPATMLLGGGLLLLSDIISQLPGYDNILPINSITALVGIPVVVWIIIKNQRMASLG